MTHIFYGNFDFEHELASPSYNRSNRLNRMNAELTNHLLALASDGDQLFFPTEPPTAFLHEAEQAGFPDVCTHVCTDLMSDRPVAIPWGWSKAAVTFSQGQDWTTSAPSLAAVLKMNSRMLSFGLEERSVGGIPGATVIDSLKQLVTAIQDASAIWNRPLEKFAWLLKAEFSMSGRERIAGHGANFDDSSRNWVGRRLVSGRRLYFEPRVESLFELSTQWNIPNLSLTATQHGSPEFFGATQLLTDSSGQYLGSVPIAASLEKVSRNTADSCLSPEILDRVVADAELAAREAQWLGYHGPLGIDAMIYRGPNGEPALRSIQDVNARLTMGRIALEWFQRFPDSEYSAWLLAPCEWLQCDELNLSPANPIIRQTSPFRIAGQPARRVGVLFARQADWTRLLATHLRP
ncbi:MAG: hypothetical protein O3B13_17980 [Planctomycetota bacterium]|nr:hypothetical protein [Planctomycetota bacterium]